MRTHGGRRRRWTALALLLYSAMTGRELQAQAPQSVHEGYPTGDSCLFCHRNDIGSTWLINSHAWTTRPAGESPSVAALPLDATHVIGNEHYRALKQNGYGKLSLRSIGGSRWQENVFERECAGCHTTAVDPATGQFSSVGLDCYSCHGNVPDDHATNKNSALLAKGRKASPKEELSICGSCHLRGGRSRATGRPYPNAYVAGDDLFEDFDIDRALALQAQFDATDTHVHMKTRAVLEGKSTKTCVDCHRVHGPPEPKDGTAGRHSEICHY
jgi:hypothetical protein